LQESLVSPGESVERATQWLQELVAELSGLRNATSRDPGFKNWRQNAITNLQRIWPVDQDHAERFRRIPFSPVDPRADTRAQRESFSRGCQEAARVLNSFIEEIHSQGVPDAPRGVQATEESGFADDFPTLNLPRGDLSNASGTPRPPSAEFEQLPPQGTDPSFLPPPRLHIDTPPSGTVMPKHHSTPPSEERPRRKGLGVAAKLRDLLGLSGFGEKPASPPAGQGISSSLPQLPPRSLDIVAVGDDVNETPSQPAWPTPQPKAQAPEPPQPPQAANVPPAETGMSVVMSRPTTLRGNIGKVSIESLISPEFRGGGESGAATPEAPESPAAETPAAPQASPAAATPTTGRPPLSIVPPLSTDPEFNVEPAPSATEPAASATEPAASATEPAPSAAEPPAATARPSKVVSLPLPRGARARNRTPDAAEPGAEPETDGEPSEPMTRSDSAEVSRATADFMRTSPVLGATGRKVQRAPQESHEHGFVDPDAIAIVSMFEELDDLGVPKTRQSEARARLLDLARRIEADDLKWAALRKAVWFAMEYPEVARRLMPLLLPWIDRAA
jgi:hypothetical protein